MLDIDRLNNVMNGKCDGRGCGRTTAMLVRAITEAELNNLSHVFVYSPNIWVASNLRDRFRSILCEMGYKAHHTPRMTWCVNMSHGDCCFYFKSMAQPKGLDTDTIGLDKCRVAVYFDHYVGEIAEQRLAERFAGHATEEQYRKEFECEWINDANGFPTNKYTVTEEDTF